MKCRIHPYEYGDGVCASCLRERLLTLISAQNELSATNSAYRRFDLAASGSDPPPPRRAPSPHIFHRRSVGIEASPAHSRDFRRFFSTPQAGPAFRAANGGGSLGDLDGGYIRKQRFWALKSLFRRRRSEKVEPDLGPCEGPSSSFWLSTLIRGRRNNNPKKKPQLSGEEESTRPSRRPRRSGRCSDRGMSPAMDDEDNFDLESSTDSSWRRATPSPMRRFSANPRPPRSVSAVSGLSVCLSPLVSFGQEARRSHPTDLGMSGELRSPVSSIHRRTPAAGLSTLAPNRSRKLSDIGRRPAIRG
ncbi:uncharacterized protein LOC122053415 [Zingiber officinale]|uniref:uncharacterized protein LOC122053415 n=1 Tax=Zingiber officinale TaxID=94328 RepID=UPI001C4AA4A8|nr:uncharacterized protein LOC122053415 [Zingiber officinale]